MWFGFVCVAALYSCLITPVEFGFYATIHPPVGVTVTDLVVNAVFIVDIILTFRLIYKDRKTLGMVHDRRMIAMR